MKLVISIIATIAVTIGALFGLNMAGINLFAETASASQTSEPNIEENGIIEEVAFRDVLVPINSSHRQRLLLLNFSVFMDENTKSNVDRDKTKIINRVLSEFSVKPDQYFKDKFFIQNLQSDLEAILAINRSWKIKEILVTKAVYQ